MFLNAMNVVLVLAVVWHNGYVYEGPVQDVIDSLSQLPGIGPKGAARIAFYLISGKTTLISELVDSLITLRDNVKFCQLCGNISADQWCKMCTDAKRDRSIICVVEESKDIQAIERTSEFHGIYHVLGGALNPLAGIGPEELSIRSLLQRLAFQQFPDQDSSIPVSEVIIATDPNTEGEATATYLARTMQVFPDLKLTRLASGLPMGGDLEFADALTLGQALTGRRVLHY